MMSASSEHRRGSSQQQLRSIGDVLAHLQAEFPDLSVSKLRYLETMELIEPDRSPKGFRRYSNDDIARITLILRAQRDHYLPLKVIKADLDALERGQEPLNPALQELTTRKLKVTMRQSRQQPADAPQELAPQRYSRSDILRLSGLTEAELDELISSGLLKTLPRSASFDEAAVRIATIIAEFADHGIDPRNLRGLHIGVERQVDLIEKVVLPLLLRRQTAVRAEADERVRELAALSVRLYSALLQDGLMRQVLR